jgi:hypothetical protein
MAYQFKRTADGVYEMEPDYKVVRVERARWEAYWGEARLVHSDGGYSPTMSEAKWLCRAHKRGIVRSVRVWCIMDVPGPAMHWPVDTPEEGAEVIRKWAEAQLEDHRIISNVFGLEEWCEECNGWEDWYGPDGESLEEFMERIEDEVQGSEHE